jgi:hypothetical protein
MYWADLGFVGNRMGQTGSSDDASTLADRDSFDDTIWNRFDCDRDRDESVDPIIDRF